MDNENKFNCDDFKELVKINFRYELLINALFYSAKLDYTKKRLDFDGTFLGAVFQSMLPDLYYQILSDLQDREFEKEI